MGNGFPKQLQQSNCFKKAGDKVSHRYRDHTTSKVGLDSDQSFRYIRHEPFRCSSSPSSSIDTNTTVTTFSSIFGANVPKKIDVGEGRGNLQWVQGRAGDDRMHVVLSDHNGWVFVGIYDGINTCDASEFLVSNLYSNIHKELERILRSDDHSESFTTGIDHSDVLRIFERALRKTEDGFLEEADKIAEKNPEFALVGSSVLVMLMKGEDVYLMNVGDSRAVLARRIDLYPKLYQEAGFTPLTSHQLTRDHCTANQEDVERINMEHPNDESTVMNHRLKGYLKITQAFGAAYLKQRNWNYPLLEMLRSKFVGTSPYITCIPSLCHHKLTTMDRFLILSSGGLFQYITNQEAVSLVESFLDFFPERNPAQHLVEVVLSRATEEAGENFYEPLNIPQGDPSRNHDDVSVVIISLE